MAYLLVNPLTCQLVNLKFRQRVDFITRCFVHFVSEV